MIARTPRPPYYAVIFTSTLREDSPDYAEMAEKMVTLAAEQPGFLGIESAREDLGISVSYWESLESIRQWKDHIDHQLAQKSGRELWYNAYKTRIAKVERDYDFEFNSN